MFYKINYEINNEYLRQKHRCIVEADSGHDAMNKFTTWARQNLNGEDLVINTGIKISDLISDNGVIYYL